MLQAELQQLRTQQEAVLAEWEAERAEREADRQRFAQVHATTWGATRLADTTTPACTIATTTTSSKFYSDEYVYGCFTFYAHA
jgi:hypothetical protein